MTDQKPIRKYLSTTYIVTVEVDEGDFAAAQRALDAIEQVASSVTHKATKVVKR